MSAYTFKKEERLHRKKIIEKLFREGKSFYIHPYKIFYRYRTASSDDLSEAEVLFSVSRRNFKNATDRNYIKRLLREAYRKNKADFYESLHQQNMHCILAIIYTSKAPVDYKFSEQKIIHSLKRLLKEMPEKIEQ